MSDWVWGCDPSSKHVAFMALREGERFPFQLDLAQRPGAQRAEKLWLIQAALPDFVRINAAVRPPLCVYVELPAGRPNPTLVGAYGIIIATLYGVLSTEYDFPVSIFSIDASSWKKIAIGQGNASKQIILEWARGRGFEHDSADVIDAYGVATAAMIELGRTP